LNNLKSTKINAIFLAAILVAGTITAVYPSFVIGSQAQEYYGMERDYKKSDKKDVSVKSIKCNNVNVNVNGLELNLSSVPFLSGLLASEAEEGERGAGSYGSGSGSYGDKSRSDGDFKFICINNNNNTVIGVDDGDDNGGVTLPSCEECFAELSADLQAAINTFLAGAGAIPIGGEEIPESVNDINGLCAFLNGLSAPLLLAQTEVEEFITQFLGAIPQPPPTGASDELDALIRCLVDAGVLIVDPDGGGPPPITCDECFADLSADLQTAINAFLAGQEAIPVGPATIPAEVNNIAQLCAFLNGLTPILILTPEEVEGFITGFLGAIPQPPPLGAEEELEALIQCLIDADVLIVQEEQPPTIAQGTSEDLSALEKITKLKKQWLGLLP
jgi:hypothetical protein